MTISGLKSLFRKTIRNIGGAEPDFCVVGMMRSGSNFLQSLITESGFAVCYGEIFNASIYSEGSPIQIGDLVDDPRSIDDKSLARFYSKFDADADTVPWGFRIFENHNNVILESLLRSPKVKVVLLTRNYVEAYFSLINARTVNQWRLTQEQSRKPHLERIEVDIDGFLKFCEQQETFYKNVIDSLERANKTPLVLDYQTLTTTDEGVEKLTSFLQLKKPLKREFAITKKQVKKPMSEVIDNYSELVDRMSKLGLARYIP